MDDLDAALAEYPITPPTLAGKPTPRKHRHDWRERIGADPANYYHGVLGYYCIRCGTVRDETRSRRGRNARKRGNALQAKAAKLAGVQNIGALGLPEDMGTSREWLVAQHKSGLGYPKLLDRWLRAQTATADQLRAVIYTETPGPGRKAKRLIVLDYDEFLSWYGGNRTPAEPPPFVLGGAGEFLDPPAEPPEPEYFYQEPDNGEGHTTK